MERAEAIKVLTNHLVHWKRLKHEHIVPTDECENTINALRMAIEALKANNVETENIVRISVADRKKDKVILYDAFGENEYYPKQTTPTIPCFAESAEAYKAWTGEEMGCKSFTADEWYRNTFKDGDAE